ncbi:hypothetical protein FK178_06905 [Antarcticibacterium arcticum]|uniref:Uncharacterized protein n=1 Tax=Antarcticibacterium arcticum TaxID=2585771 RepID=A0A5B8YKY8_9FLAO|nr:hypothetical protein [Antarcticibacterium arcticum]QED37467.1 hypothetical protein FK178_06905 [Antarcticibacterium arcticum]
MSKRKTPNSNATAGQGKAPGTRSEIEPVSPERSAKGDDKFVTLEPNILKHKKSVPPDSTAQRGKSPGSTSKEEKKKMGK